MNNFIYYTPTKVFFGKDTETKVGEIINEYHPKKVLIHYGGHSAINSGLLDRVISYLDEQNIKHIELGGVVPNPELSLVNKGIELAKKEEVDFVLAIGGGSVLDSAKDIANGVANPSDNVWDYHLGKNAPKSTLKKGAILTIAAAGSEMSDSCVITNEQTGQKRGYCSIFNRMDFAIENPELTYTVSAYQTSCGAVDIAMHTIERYFDLGEETYVTDAIAEGIIKATIKAGLDAYNNPLDYDARANMMWASSLAHNGLTHCGREFQLTVHQLEHELSGMYPTIAHGAGLAALWCSWARYTYSSCDLRFKQYAINVWGVDPKAKSNDEIILEAINKQERYYKQIGMPTSLKELGIKEEDLETLADLCSRHKTRVIKGYKNLSYKEILDIYKLAF